MMMFRNPMFRLHLLVVEAVVAGAPGARHLLSLVLLVRRLLVPRLARRMLGSRVRITVVVDGEATEDSTHMLGAEG